ncbi:MAG: Alpha-1,4-glucan:maltose-1-phosphate maltosyltransferase [Thermoanaerobaculia bacterium]|nr:Alpha-1,4-glucan:maltose-1-phosphate maltosyltransferase [Thermoanaerobaculia bacterium]
MSHWPRYPTIYEINTWVWLTGLSAELGVTVTLGSVPQEEWDRLARRGFDAVWLMGVWERSPAGIAIANGDPGLRADFRTALPDYTDPDNVGSPYCVRRYVADQRLGGPEGLAAARQELARRGIRLILDFVPNHVAPDHPWVSEHPEYFVEGTEDDARNAPSSFLALSGRVFACGRDPYFPAWPDVLQLNAFSPGLRDAASETLVSIARQCDGVRCDMAMLFLTSVFGHTWGGHVRDWPAEEYWRGRIRSARETNGDFLFIAEAYWDLEWDLQQAGFDFCYDKRLYDRLEHGDAESVKLHLCADLGYQARLLRFLENHDEPRAAALLSPERERAAALATYTLPGARLFHQGQFEGAKVKLPVFLGRRPKEPVQAELLEFYERLLRAIDAPVFRSGEWSLCERRGWPDNPSYLNIVAWCFREEGDRRLIIVNLSGQASSAMVQVPWEDLGGADWFLTDSLSTQSYQRSGDDLREGRLFVDLGPWGSHFFRLERG